MDLSLYNQFPIDEYFASISYFLLNKNAATKTYYWFSSIKAVPFYSAPVYSLSLTSVTVHFPTPLPASGIS